MNDVAIQTQEVSKSFGPVQALQGITLEIHAGMIYGLLGPNGAGKTTLIRLLTGSTKRRAGSITLLGLDPQHDKRLARRRIGYMPQSPALYDDLSSIENVRFFGRAHGIDHLKQRTDEVIDFVGLTDRARDPIYKFSGGMKQRISLACALVHQPDVLLLDEPTTGIDPKLRETFWSHFRDLASSGVTLVISTHQMDEALYCDRLAILNRGRLLADDTPRRLMRSGQTRVKLWQGERATEHEFTNYPEQLPQLLQGMGLDASVSRIEIEEDTLETIVLRLINQRPDATQEEV